MSNGPVLPLSCPESGRRGRLSAPAPLIKYQKETGQEGAQFLSPSTPGSTVCRNSRGTAEQRGLWVPVAGPPSLHSCFSQRHFLRPRGGAQVLQLSASEGLDLSPEQPAGSSTSRSRSTWASTALPAAAPGAWGISEKAAAAPSHKHPPRLGTRLQPTCSPLGGPTCWLLACPRLRAA